jgi:hypothetical protein
MGGDWGRGNDVCDRLRPDATGEIGGKVLHVELDTGETPYRKTVEERFVVYEGRTDDVLWIAPTVSRMEGLRRRADMLTNNAMFTTYDRCLEEWVCVNGERIPVQKGVQEGVHHAGSC